MLFHIYQYFMPNLNYCHNIKNKVRLLTYQISGESIMGRMSGDEKRNLYFCFLTFLDEIKDCKPGTFLTYETKNKDVTITNVNFGKTKLFGINKSLFSVNDSNVESNTIKKMQTVAIGLTRPILSPLLGFPQKEDMLIEIYNSDMNVKHTVIINHKRKQAELLSLHKYSFGPNQEPTYHYFSHNHHNLIDYLRDIQEHPSP